MPHRRRPPHQPNGARRVGQQRVARDNRRALDADAMPTLQTSLAFFSVAVLLALAPGPDNLFVLMQSATGGRRAGFAVLAGLMLSVLVHTLVQHRYSADDESGEPLRRGAR